MQQIKQYEKKYVLIIIHNKKGLLHSADLGIWYNRVTSWLEWIKVPFWFWPTE